MAVEESEGRLRVIVDRGEVFAVYLGRGKGLTGQKAKGTASDDSASNDTASNDTAADLSTADAAATDAASTDSADANAFTCDNVPLDMLVRRIPMSRLALTAWGVFEMARAAGPRSERMVHGRTSRSLAAQLA